jgi:sugar phosphate isomerase/epimerase
MKPITRRSFLAATALAAAAPKLFAQNAPKYKIIGFSKPFQNLNPEQCAETVAEIGWDGIECPIRPQGQIEPERAPDELPKLIEALKKRGKEVTIATTGITSASQPGAEQLLRLCAKLGIKRYRVGFIKYTDKKSIPDQVKEVAAAAKDLAALNKELGIVGGIQNHSGHDYFGAPVWDIWTAIKDLDPRYFGNFFDIAHATIEGGLSWPIEARLMEPFMMTVSVKDFVWEKGPSGGKMKWVPMGDGLVDKSFFKWLKTTAFEGPISLHVEYDHGQGKAMIEKIQNDVKALRSWLA